MLQQSPSSSHQDIQRKISLFTIFSFCFYSFINTILLSIPYFQLNLNTHIFSEILRNWNSYPILDLTVAATCPDGYESLTPRSWPGASFGCWCGNTTPNKNIKCDPFCSNPCSSAELITGCLDVPGETPKSLNFWAYKGSNPVQICLKRSSETWEEIAPISIKSCPSGYKKCGASWDNIFCTKETECPITAIQISRMTSTEQTRCLASPLVCMVLDDSTTNPRMIQFRRGDTFDGKPIVDIRVNEYSMCSKLNQDNITPDRLQFPLLNQQEETCEDDSGDTSWVKIDEMTESSLFDLNGLSTYINSLNGYTSSGMSGYYETGTTGDDYTWGIFTRQYFPWKATCRKEMGQVIEKLNNIDQIKTAQLLVMIFGLVVGFLVGTVMIYIEVQQMRRKKIFFININWGNEKGIKRFWVIKDIMMFLFVIMQVPAEVCSLIVVGNIQSLFFSAYNKKCAGNFTGEALNEFALERLTQCFACTVISLAITGALLALYFGLARQRNKNLKIGGCDSSRVMPVESEEKSISAVNQSSSGMVFDGQGSLNIGRRGMNVNEGGFSQRKFK